MRSIVLALTLAVSGSAFAATTATYTSPLTKSHTDRQQFVSIVFANKTTQEREVRVGNEQYRIEFGKALRLSVPVGATVQVYSNQNSKVYGQTLIQVSANDADRVVTLK